MCAKQTSNGAGAQENGNLQNSTIKSSNKVDSETLRDVQSSRSSLQSIPQYDLLHSVTEAQPGQLMFSRELGDRRHGLSHETDVGTGSTMAKDTLRDLRIRYEQADEKYKKYLEDNTPGHHEDGAHLNIDEQVKARYENIKQAALEHAHGGKPDLLTQLYTSDGTENIWSIMTDDLTYCRDLFDKQQELTFKNNRHTATHVKWQNSARKLNNVDNDDKYHAVHSRIVPTLNLDSEISASYIGSLKGATSKLNQKGEMTGSYKMNPEAFSTGTTLDQKSKVTILNDTGCSKAVVNERWLNKYDPDHKLPRYKVNTRTIKVGNGQTLHVNEAVRLAIIIQGHIIEIIAIIMNCGDETIDIVLGSKAFFELEADIDYTNLQVNFKMRARPISTTKSFVLEPGETRTLRMQVHDLPEDWTAHRVIAKLQDKNQQTWNYHTKEIFVNDQGDLRIQVTNNSTKPVSFNKNQILGSIDTRSAGYFHVTRNVLVEKSQHQIMTLSDEDTLTCMHEHYMEIKKINEQNPTVKNDKDKYPWLPDGDERKTMTDEEIITKYVDLSESILTEKEKKTFRKVMLKYKKAFSLREEIGMCSMPPVELELKDDTPFYIRPYAVKSEEEKEFIDNEMRKGCLLGYLKRGLSSYSSPIMVIPRKHSSQKYRLVTDFRFLNSRLVRLNPSLPLVRDTLRRLGESESDTLSVIDLRDAYHTIRIAENSKKYCGITPYQGASTYLYQRLGMGLSVSPAIWCNFIEKVMTELPSQDHHIAIMDDIMIHSKRADHMQQIINLFKVLIKHGLKISPKKCQFFRTSLVYMGHNVIIKDGKPCVKPVQTMIDAIAKLEPPTTVKGVRGFCGMVNFLHFYIKDIQIILAPLRKLTRVGVNFVWSEECKEAFQKAKESIMKAPVLVLPNKHGLFQIESDTSIIGCGGALFQIQEGIPRLCGYYSKKLPEVVTRYGITELEMLGLTCNVMAFRYLVLKRFFEVYVDHKCIENIWIAKTEPATKRIGKCLETLSAFTFIVIYRKGSEMHTADFLSRHPMDNEKEPVLPVSFLLIKDIYCQIETRSKRRARLAMEAAEKAAHKGQIQVQVQPVQSLPRQVHKPKIDLQSVNLQPKVSLQRLSPAQLPSKRIEPGVLKSIPNKTPASIKPQEFPVPVLNSQVNEETVSTEEIQKLINKALEEREKMKVKIKPSDDYEGENVIPIDITLHGHLPSDIAKLDQKLPDDIDKRQKQALFDKRLSKLEIVRRTLPQQKHLNNLLSKLSKSAIHNYNLPLSAMELITGYERSPYFKDIYRYLKTGMCSYSRNLDKRFQAMCQNFVLIQGLLFKLRWFENQETPELVLCIPEHLVPYILYQYHDNKLAGHQGITRTLLTVQSEFFFPKMYQTISTYIQTCHRCQTAKNEAQRLPQAMQARIPANFRPFDRMSMDIKNMPESSDEYQYILICTCDITNYVVAIPLKELTTARVFEAIFQRIICVFNKPTQIVCDQASIFTSKLMDGITQMLKIKLKFVGKENHGANQTERYIQSLNNIMRKYLEEQGVNWPMYVAPAAYAMNTFISPSTQHSPYEMVFGRKPSILGNLDYKNIVLPEYKDANQYITHLQTKIKQMAEKVINDRTERQQQQQIHELRKESIHAKLTKGDLVLLKRPACSDLNPEWRKLTRDWVGPLRIVAVLTEDKFLLSDWTGRIVPIIAQRREIKPYFLRNLSLNHREVASAIREGAKVIELIHKARAVDRGQKG